MLTLGISDNPKEEAQIENEKRLLSSLVQVYAVLLLTILFSKPGPLGHFTPVVWAALLLFVVIRAHIKIKGALANIIFIFFSWLFMYGYSNFLYISDFYESSAPFLNDLKIESIGLAGHTIIYGIVRGCIYFITKRK